MKLKCSKLFQKLNIKLLTLMFALLGLCSCKNTVGDKMADFIESGKSDTLRIADFTEFDWDEIWIFHPNMHNDCLRILDSTGIDTGNINNIRNTSSGFSRWSEYLDIMIFVYEKKIVYQCFPPVKNPRTVDWYPLFEFRFPEKTDFLRLPKEKAIFKENRRELSPLS